MSFFCDTGVILAYAKPEDPSYPDAFEHFEENPPYEKHYMCKIVADECEKKKKDFKKYLKGRGGLAVRYTKEQIDYLLSAMEYVDHSNEVDFYNLRDSLHITLKKIIPDKIISNDCHILSQALLWHYCCDLYDQYHFITVDKHDIYDNKSTIESVSNTVCKSRGKCELRYILWPKNHCK